MASVRKQLAAAAGNGTSGTAVNLYAASGTAGTDTVVSSLVVCNVGSAAATFRVAINTVSATYASGRYLFFDTQVAANDTLTFTLGLVLDPTNRYLNVSSSSADVNFSIYGSENS